MKKIIALCGALCALLALSAAALAHAEMKSCTPAMNGAVETAPTQVVCIATESMDAKGSTLAVFDAHGMQVDKKDSAVDLDDPDRVRISVSLDTAMMQDGEYTVKWTTVSAADSDEAKGEFTFTVGHAMDMHATPAATETDTTEHPGGDHSIGIAQVDGKEITLKIMSPLADAELPAGMVQVRTMLDGATLGENDSHLHFYVDGNLALMSQGAQTDAAIEIKEPGEHEIAVTYSDHDHMDLMQVHVRVMVVTAAQATATSAPTSAPEPTKPPEPTAAPTSAPTPTIAPTPEASTLPTTGSGGNLWVYTFLAGLGVGIVGAGVYAAVRARR